MGKDNIKNLINAHLEAEVPECRWCFAVDMQRVPGKIIAQHLQATLLKASGFQITKGNVIER